MVTINEFSRHFINPKKSDKSNRYVSQGYEKEIGFTTADVPQEIQEAVHHGDFRINDSYPPADNQIALIAREIANYSILAVATNGGDEGGRPSVVYRYFWIEKLNNQAVDGVGTLLLWWHHHNQPYCELMPTHEWEQKIKNRPSADWYYPNHFKAYQSEIETLLSKITTYPIVKEVNSLKYDKINYLAWHSLALSWKEKYKTPLAWAWNISSLEYPSKFILISCTTESVCQTISSQVTQKLLANYSSFVIQGSGTQKTSGTRMTNQDAQSIKKALKEISQDKNLQANFQKICDVLKRIPSVNWDWDNIVDQIIFNNNNDIFAFRYKALLLILCPRIEPIEWLLNLVQSKNKTAYKAAITLQAKFFDYCYLNYTKPVYEPQLKDRIYGEIIPQLLNTILDYPNHYNVIKWLFIDSYCLIDDEKLRKQSSWGYYLINYGKILFDYLVNLSYSVSVKNNQDSFCEQLSKDLHKYNSKKTFPKYLYIAQLFEEAKRWNLAAFFYQISLGEVPSEIYDNLIEYEIIPLTRQPTLEKKENPVLKALTSKTATTIYELLLIVLLLSGVGVLGFFLKPLLSPLSQTPNDIIRPSFEKDLFMYSETLKTGDKFKKMGNVWANIDTQPLEEKIINNLDHFIDPIQAQDKKPDYQPNEISQFLKSKYVPKTTLELPSKLENSISLSELSSTPPIPEVTITQVFLKVNNFYQGEITGVLDLDTATAIQQFQQQEEITPTNTGTSELDNQTWQKIVTLINTKQNKIKDKISQEEMLIAAKFLHQTIQESQSYSELKQNLDKLSTCSKQDKNFSYIICVNKLIKESE